AHQASPALKPTRTLSEARPLMGSALSLEGRAKFCDTAQAWPPRPTHQHLWLTIQSRSPTICQPPHSAGRGDKDQCDEKQPRQQACAPLSHERLTPNLPQNHSNFSECGLSFQAALASTTNGNPLELNRSRPSFQSHRLPNC